MKGKKKEHNWLYMGVAKNHLGELGYCDLCKKYRLNQTIITEKYFKEIKIDGSENW